MSKKAAGANHRQEKCDPENSGGSTNSIEADEPIKTRWQELFEIQCNLIRELSFASAPDEAFNRILETVIEIHGAGAAALYIYDENKHAMDLKCHKGLSKRFVEGHCSAKEGEPEYTDLLGNRPIQKNVSADLREEGIQTAIIFPIIHDNNPIATICVGLTENDSLSRNNHEAIGTLCTYLGGIITRLKTEETLRLSKHRIHGQFMNVPVPAYTWRCDGDDFSLVDANPAALKFTKNAVIQIYGIKASKYFADRPDIIKSLKNCYAKKTSSQVIYPYQFKYVEMKKHLRVTFTYSPPDQVLAYTEDITSEKQAIDEQQIVNEKLKLEQSALIAKNIALEEVLAQIEKEKTKTGQKIQANIDSRVLPLLRRLGEGASTVEQKYLQLIQQNLNEITSPFVNRLLTRYRTLTPREVEISTFIMQGLTSKDIAGTLAISEETVRCQRKNIRKKLKINNTAANLQSYLLSLFRDM